MYYILIIHSSDGRLLGDFHILSIMNNTNMNILIQVFVWTCFQFFGEYT